jgi:hypothetical protein
MTTLAGALMSVNIVKMSVERNRRNWRRIIEEIKTGYRMKHGRELTDNKLADLADMNRSSIVYLQTPPIPPKKEWPEPRHDDGERLLQIHLEYWPLARVVNSDDALSDNYPSP